MKIAFKKLVFLSVANCCLLAGTAFAQSQKLYTSKGAWHPAGLKNRSYQKGSYYGFTVDQQNKMFNNMGRVLELIHQTPFLNPPKGYDIGVYNSLCEQGCDKTKPISGASGFIILYYYTKGDNPKVEKSVEGPSVNLYFNDIGRLVSRIGVSEDDYFPEPIVTDSINGFPIYQDFVVITKIKEPLFVSLTREQELKISIKQKEAALMKTKKTFSEPTHYKQWLANKEANMKATLSGLAILAKTDPEKAKIEKEKYLKGIAETERNYKESEAQIVQQQNDALQKWESELNAEKERLAALTPEEKNEPVFTEDGRKYVVPNKAFFNPSLPPYAIQLIVMDLYKYGDRPTLAGKHADNAIKTLQKELGLTRLLSAMN